MLLAINCPAALDVKVRYLRARVIRAAPAVHVNHAVFGMLPAVRRRLALEIEVRSLRAVVTGTSHARNDDHSILGMLLAIQRLFGTLGIKDGLLHAGVIEATFDIDINHAVLSMLLTVRCRLAAFDVKGRPFCAGVL